MSKFPIRHPKSNYEVKISRLFGCGADPLSPLEGYCPPFSVVICFTNRCGSNFLASALESTGQFPRAGEYFNVDLLKALRNGCGFNSLEEACIHICTKRTVGNMFVTKLGWQQLYFLTKMRVIPYVLGAPKIVFISRRNLLDQAISLAIATQTKSWTSSQPIERTAVYDRNQILTVLQGLSRANANFKVFFATFGMPTFDVVYEDLIEDTAGIVEQISLWCGLESRRVEPAQIKIRPQRNSVNDEWRSRFLEEMDRYFKPLS